MQKDVISAVGTRIFTWGIPPLQPLIPVATILEGALLGAVDTGYIAKRTGLGIAIALVTIYTSQSVLHMGLLGIWVGLASFFCQQHGASKMELLDSSTHVDYQRTETDLPPGNFARCTGAQRCATSLSSQAGVVLGDRSATRCG